MPKLVNTSDRLINTHDMTALPPGVTVEVSDEAMAHPDIQQAMTDGILTNPEGAIDATKRREEEAKKDQPSPTFNTGTVEEENKTRPGDKQSVTGGQNTISGGGPGPGQPTQQRPVPPNVGNKS